MSENEKPNDQSTANDAPPTLKVKTDAELMRENEMLKAQLKVREDQLREAIGITNKAIDQQKAREDAEKTDLMDRIIVDSGNKFTKDELSDKSLSELRLIKTAVSKSYDSTFASIAALQRERDQRAAPQFTVGYYDSATKTWKGGI